LTFLELKINRKIQRNRHNPTQYDFVLLKGQGGSEFTQEAKSYIQRKRFYHI